MILDETALQSLIADVLRRVLREEGRAVASAPERYVSVGEAARRIDVAPATVREWIGQGRLGRYNAGRELRVKVSELDAILTTPLDAPDRSPEEEARLFLERRGARHSSRR